MSGAHRLGVQVGRVDALATQTQQSATELHGVGDRVGAALRQLAGATPGTGLAVRAEGASGAWAGGLGDLARAGDSLALATVAAAEAYRMVEVRGVQRFTGRGPQ